MRCMGRIGIGLAVAGIALCAHAGAGQKAESAANKASATAVKTENAVKRGLRSAESGVERGVKAADKAITGVAKKAGIPGAGASAPKQPQTMP